MVNKNVNMKTYICHYPKLTERIESLIPSLEKNGFDDIEIVYGIDRNDINENHFSIFSNDIMHKKEREFYKGCVADYTYDILSKPAEIANFLTHLEIWDRISKSSQKHCLVLEDDVVTIDDNFTETWNRYMESIPDDLEIAYLNEGCDLTVKNKLGLDIVDDKIWYDCYIKESRTCCAYIISSDFCTKIIDFIKSNPVVYAVDHELNFIQKKNDTNVYWTYPCIFREGSGDIYKSSLR
jgi:GR25 family glycosyltransferase involved in LPS biosynthesis